MGCTKPNKGRTLLGITPTRQWHCVYRLFHNFEFDPSCLYVVIQECPAFGHIFPLKSSQAFFSKKGEEIKLLVPNIPGGKICPCSSFWVSPCLIEGDIFIRKKRAEWELLGGRHLLYTSSCFSLYYPTQLSLALLAFVCA